MSTRGASSAYTFENSEMTLVKTIPTEDNYYNGRLNTNIQQRQWSKSYNTQKGRPLERRPLCRVQSTKNLSLGHTETISMEKVSTRDGHTSN